MRINFCPSCGKSLQVKSTLCFECGEDLEDLLQHKENDYLKEGGLKSGAADIIEQFLENHTELLKELTSKTENGENFKKGIFFAVEVREGKPVIKKGNIKDLDNLLKNTPFYPSFQKINGSAETQPIEFNEVKGEIREIEKGKEIKVQLPGIDSQDKLTINRIDDGIEIIGAGKEKIYFSKVPLEQNAMIKSSKLNDGILTIKIT
jgi:HSP20 family molecular chaperone IbpA